MIKNFKEYKDLLLEKSNLTVLGIPREVMQPIQKDLALPSDSNWEKMEYKRDIVRALRTGEENLFIQISIKSIKVFVSYPTAKETVYFIDKYLYKDSGWGGEYEKQKRDFKTITQLAFEIEPGANIYKLDGDFSVNTQGQRAMIKKEVSFGKFSDLFKSDFLKKFDSILKRISGSNFKKAKEKVTKKAKAIEIKNKHLIANLDNPLAGDNSLSILDEFIIQFEDEYSSYFDERLDIQEISEYFGRDKVLRMFMYYIYTGKKMTN